MRKRVIGLGFRRRRKAAADMGGGTVVCGGGKEEMEKGEKEGYREIEESEWRRAKEREEG